MGAGRMRRIRMGTTAPTLGPGQVNANGQRVVRAEGVASTQRRGQRVYRLHCERCGHEYGVAGIDVKDRRCPACQGGVAAEEPLQERAATLFE